MRRLVLVALTGVAIVVLAVAPTLAAQPSPPNRFYGGLTIDNQPAPAGTQVRAFVGDKDCTTQRDPFTVPAGQYAVEVAGTSQIQGCAAEGSEITFRVGTRTANEKGAFRTGQFTKLDLTVGGTLATATPGPTASATPTPTPSPTPTPTPPAQTGTVARLDLNPDTSRCIPPAGEESCSDGRDKLWKGDTAAWTAEYARQGKPAPSADDIFVQTYEYRIGANDPAAIASLARGLGWPKMYITAIKFRGAAPGEADEYIEITNVGGAAQDMTGWRAFAVDSATDFFFSDGTVLEPRAVCRFYTGQTQADSCPGSINVATGGVWNDNAGSAELWYDPLALLADKTRYSADPANQPPPPNLRLASPAG